MELVGNYFDPEKAALATEALQRAGIQCEQRRPEDPEEPGIDLLVPEESLDAAASILEKLEDEFQNAEVRKIVACPQCGSTNLQYREESGHFANYVFYQCEKCQHEFLGRYR